MTYSYSTILLLSIGLFYVTNNQAIPLLNYKKSIQCCVAISISSLDAEAGYVCRNCNILTTSFFKTESVDQKNSTKTTLQNETKCISQEENFLSWRMTPKRTVYERQKNSPIHKNCQKCSGLYY
ncbi:MAG: hypothetical protein ACRCZ0_07660 [Cetobacterium sp.]